MTIKGRRNSPNSPLPTPKFRLLLGGVFMQPIRRISKDGLKTVIHLLLQPIKTVGMNELSTSDMQRGLPGFFVQQTSLNSKCCPVAHTVNAPILSHETPRSIQTEVGTDGRCGCRPNDLGHAFLNLFDRKRF